MIDVDKTFDLIKELPLAEKHKRIQHIQKEGFKYDDKTVKEIIKDKWVFLENGSETDIVDIDFVLLQWEEEEDLRIQKEDAKNGNSVAERYFRKYGTISKKEKLERGEGYLHNQTLYFDVNPCPGDGWNMELFMYRLGVYKDIQSDYSNEASYVNFYADMNVEDSMDAEMKGDLPTIRHSHDWYTNPHKKGQKHYKYENWLQDIETAKSLFLNEVNKMMKGCKTFQYNSKQNVFCTPEQFVFWFFENADHNGDETGFYRSKIYSKNKYKGMGYSSNTRTVPAKFDKTITKEEVLEMAAKYCEEKLEKHKFRKEFKY